MSSFLASKFSKFALSTQGWPSIVHILIKVRQVFPMLDLDHSSPHRIASVCYSSIFIPRQNCSANSQSTQSTRACPTCQWLSKPQPKHCLDWWLVQHFASNLWVHSRQTTGHFWGWSPAKSSFPFRLQCALIRPLFIWAASQDVQFAHCLNLVDLVS